MSEGRRSQRRHRRQYKRYASIAGLVLLVVALLGGAGYFIYDFATSPATEDAGSTAKPTTTGDEEPSTPVATTTAVGPSTASATTATGLSIELGRTAGKPVSFKRGSKVTVRGAGVDGEYKMTVEGRVDSPLTAKELEDTSVRSNNPSATGSGDQYLTIGNQKDPKVEALAVIRLQPPQFFEGADIEEVALRVFVHTPGALVTLHEPTGEWFPMMNYEELSKAVGRGPVLGRARLNARGWMQIPIGGPFRRWLKQPSSNKGLAIFTDDDVMLIVDSIDHPNTGFRPRLFCIFKRRTTGRAAAGHELIELDTAGWPAGDYRISCEADGKTAGVAAFKLI